MEAPVALIVVCCVPDEVARAVRSVRLRLLVGGFQDCKLRRLPGLVGERFVQPRPIVPAVDDERIAKGVVVRAGGCDLLLTVQEHLCGEGVELASDRVIHLMHLIEEVASPNR